MLTTAGVTAIGFVRLAVSSFRLLAARRSFRIHTPHRSNCETQPRTEKEAARRKASTNRADRTPSKNYNRSRLEDNSYTADLSNQ